MARFQFSAVPLVNFRGYLGEGEHFRMAFMPPSGSPLSTGSVTSFDEGGPVFQRPAGVEGHSRPPPLLITTPF